MRRPRKSINQINVVPYIDVMLVLLIIFMVTAPLISPGVIDLPTVRDAPPSRATPPIEITIKADRSYLIRDQASGDAQRRISRDDLVARMAERVKENPEQNVVIAADKSIRYEEVTNMIDLLQRTQVKKVGLLARPGQ